MRLSLAIVIVLLIIAAWEQRKNKALFFMWIAGLFGCVAALASHQPDWIVNSLAIGWLIAALIALWFAINKLLHYLRKKMMHS
ncbi:MAG TPA: hypothetical protein VJ324_08435 [Candidatus Acidoferrum sp.]|jgi:type III secretory pathway component EscU|nr:hypothetical protein [Candidatus Acidoferrum sp.]